MGLISNLSVQVQILAAGTFDGVAISGNTAPETPHSD